MLRSRLRRGEFSLADDEFFYYFGVGDKGKVKMEVYITKIFMSSKGIHRGGAVVLVDLIEPGDAAGEVFGAGVPGFSLTPIECICQFRH